MKKTVNNPWRIEEKNFDTRIFSKHESIMCQGNGYMGIRASHEEEYLQNTRGMFIAGIYNKAGENEVEEIPNAADIMAINLEVCGSGFNLLEGNIIEYKRYLNLLNGELVRRVIWKDNNENKYNIIFKRFVSFHNINLVVQRVEIQPLDNKAHIKFKSGIDGRQSNSGVQHFDEIEKRVYENKYIQYIQRTNNTKIDVIVTTNIKTNKNSNMKFAGDRRRIFAEFEEDLDINETLVIEKCSLIKTTFDKEYYGKLSTDKLKEKCIDELAKLSTEKYEILLNNSATIWRNKYAESAISIESKNNFDQYAINFAVYHLQVMTPFHDSRYSVGAKGISGEGYKGHVFWDTEIFILPYFLYNNPETARRLLEYRYNCLEEAKNKAKKNKFEGALFPWESCVTGKEETPEYAAMNIKTGKREKVWSAVKEHHIVADIAYAVIQYYKSTNDEEFMKNKGITLLLECSKFWVSRCTERGAEYVILDVIGPDEYTEHVDNNAYTNYLAWYTVKETITLAKEFNVECNWYDLEDFVNRIYIPVGRADRVIPQDDTFLSKKIIDVTKYRESKIKQTILKDYTRHEVVDMQVLKQADLIMLMYLLNEYFDNDIIKANWKYYEAKTIHDSSLSMAIHSITATYFDNISVAYKCFEEACRLDIGENIHSSDEGIHSAAIGAIWLAIINGFAGVNTRGNILKVSPKLPEEWNSIRFNFTYKGEVLKFNISKDSIGIEREKQGNPLEININNNIYKLFSSININLSGN